jgi:hypothetical protein
MEPITPVEVEQALIITDQELLEQEVRESLL